MNLVDRIFIAFVLLLMISLGTVSDVLELFTLEECLIILCLYIIMWQLLVMICDELLKRINKPHRVKRGVVNGKLPERKVKKPELHVVRDIARFDVVAEPISDIEKKVDKIIDVKT